MCVCVFLDLIKCPCESKEPHKYRKRMNRRILAGAPLSMSQVEPLETCVCVCVSVSMNHLAYALVSEKMRVRPTFA